MDQRPGIRREILDTLLAYEKTGEKAGDLIREKLRVMKDAPKGERAFFSRTVLGTVERLITLDAVTECYSKIPVSEMKPVIRNILRMSVYQILFMEGVRNAAAVDEAVKLAKEKGLAGLSGFVNGVLRSVIREPEKISLPDRPDIKKYISVRYSVPEFLVDEWIRDYGEDTAEKICSSFLAPAPMAVRLESLTETREDILKSLISEGVTVEKAPYPDGAYFISGYDRLEDLRVFREGKLYVQDVNAQLISLLTGAFPGCRVLDMCAAPGGKSVCMAYMMKNTGEMIARDISEAKTALIKENVKRMGLGNIKVEVRDALAPDPVNKGSFDIVVADVPCSGYGVIGKKPDIKYGASKEKEDALIRLQRDMLQNAAELVKDGGALVYMTCTFNKRENEENVRWFTENHDFRTEDLSPGIPKNAPLKTNSDGTLTILPGTGRGGGFFAARFEKSSR